MKIKRYVAKDMRTALAQIKEELGVDAVIMSNKKIPEGVELMAAVDYSHTPSAKTVTGNKATQDHLAEDVVNLSANKAIQDDFSAQPVNSPMNDAAPVDSLATLLSRNIQQKEPVDVVTTKAPQDLELQLKQFTDKLKHQVGGNSIQEKPPEDSSFTENIAASSKRILSNHTGSSSGQNVVSHEAFEQMKAEMASIRQLLEHQVSGLMWQDIAQKDPARAMLIDKLVALGIHEDMADQIAGYLPPSLPEEDSWKAALQLLTNQINTTNNDIIHHGGVVSLVGPTGVGKTTSLAKLAARFAQVHGADELVLISTDTYRIGGFEQLETYGKIIGCSVHLAKDPKDLEALIQQFSSKKLILIDTAGMGQRDLRLSEHLTNLVLNNRVRIRNYLVLAANTQQAVMQENVERFKKIPLCGCIFTKLDESLSMGEIISIAIQNGLPIGYLTDGQRVPEDIKVANAEKLVSLAEKIANKSAMKVNFIANRQPTAAVALG